MSKVKERENREISIRKSRQEIIETLSKGQS